MAVAEVKWAGVGHGHRQGKGPGGQAFKRKVTEPTKKTEERMKERVSERLFQE